MGGIVTNHPDQAAQVRREHESLSDAERRLMATYKYDEPRAVDELRSRGKLHRMTYKGTLANPRLAADRLAKFVEEPFDAAAAAAVVESRTERCAPDLSFEIGEDP